MPLPFNAGGFSDTGGVAKLSGELKFFSITTDFFHNL
jgi:hypothetical protein